MADPPVCTTDKAEGNKSGEEGMATKSEVIRRGWLLYKSLFSPPFSVTPYCLVAELF